MSRDAAQITNCRENIQREASLPLARSRDRRVFLAGGLSAVASLLLASCGRAGKGGGTGRSVPTQLGWLKDMEFAGIYVADRKGFFAEEGIDLRLLGGGPNATTVSQGVSGGSAVFGVGSQFGEIASAIKAGSNLVVLGAIQQRSLACIISLPARPIANIEALAHKRIGASNPELARAAFQGLGIPDVQIVKVGGDISPLLVGEVDGYVGYMSNQVLALRSRDIASVVLPLEDIGLPAYGGLIVTARSTLERDRALVRGYLRAMIKGHELNMRDPSYGAQITVQHYAADQALDGATALAANKAYIEFESSPITQRMGLFWIDTQRVQGPIYSTLGASGLTDLPAPASYIDLSLLRELYAGRNSLLDKVSNG
jgi:ABC-type nitrate/sulfonate/bicarbonate transport system substrate-binding protein